jgi:hypothetical protein
MEVCIWFQHSVKTDSCCLMVASIFKNYHRISMVAFWTKILVQNKEKKHFVMQTIVLKQIQNVNIIQNHLI